jgi:hypothetical protein
MTKLIDLNTGAITKLLENASAYRKVGTVKAVQVAGGKQKVVTVLQDGYVETENVAHEGDFVVTNPSGEQYVVKESVFNARYVLEDVKIHVYKAKGVIKAFQYTDSDIEVVASWGEKVRGKAGCYIAMVFDDGEYNTDRYLIGEKVFTETYEKVESEVK